MAWTEEDERTHQERLERLRAEVRPRLTPGFLETLRLAATAAGRECDEIEVANFLDWCRARAEEAQPR